MKNFEEIKNMNTIVNNVFDTLNGDDEEKQREAFNDFALAIAEDAKETAKDMSTELYAAMKDEQILVNRGVRRAITSQEMKFFNEAVRKQKLDGLDVLFPTTIIETVMEDLTKDHPLLSAIDTRTTEAAVKFIYGDPTERTAFWDVIPADIKQILLGAFKVLDMKVSKLSGFVALPKGYFQLGPSWLANYVVTFLKETMIITLESALVNGDGKLKPIGMMRKLSGAVDGVYPEKETVAITDLNPKSFAGPRSLLAKNKTLSGQVSVIINPVTYETKIAPSLLFQNTQTGVWTQLGLPYGMNYIPSYAVPEDKAILGNAKNYLLAVAGNLEIKKYEETLAIEDMDLYIAKEFAAGLPKNPNAFVVLDLSGVEGVEVPSAEGAPNLESKDTIYPVDEV